MKSILLATASILAFAGAAAADVTFGGDAKLGFNIDNGDEARDTRDIITIDPATGLPTVTTVTADGFFYEANLGVTLSQELNNGLTAAASFTLNIAQDDDGSNVDVDNDFLLSLTTEEGGLFLGDTAFAAESHWDSAGNMGADDFSEQDGEVVLKGDFSFSGIEASVSGIVADDENDRPVDRDLDQISIGAEATVGRFNMSLGYQEESEELDNVRANAVVTVDPVTGLPNGAAFGGGNGIYDPSSNDDFDVSEVFGISAGTTFGGADIELAYAKNNTYEDDSLGLEVSAPVGPLTLGAFYVLENNDASFEPTINEDGVVGVDVGNDGLDDSFGISASYTGGPLTVTAFYNNDAGDHTNDIDTDFDGVGDVSSDDDQDYGLEVGYDVGNGLEVYAGLLHDDKNYIGAEYDLGNGAQLIASYSDKDEIGAREYEGGTTLLVKFNF
jgi:hypothetical protein